LNMIQRRIKWSRGETEKKSKEEEPSGGGKGPGEKKALNFAANDTKKVGKGGS